MYISIPQRVTLGAGAVFLFFSIMQAETMIPIIGFTIITLFVFFALQLN
jgi:hypothetical protein